MNIPAVNTSYPGMIPYNAVPVSSNGDSPYAVQSTTTDQSSVQPVPDNTVPNASGENTGENQTEDNKGQYPQTNISDVYNTELTQAEQMLIQELQQTDAEVRRHEMAHVAAGGALITSGANFTYQKGPDRKNYAVGGEVSIDTSPVPGDPEATLKKMRQIRSAALAPANPSAQDVKVASKASQTASKALSELMLLDAKHRADTNETKAFGNIHQVSDSYTKVNDLPEEDTHSFQIAV